MTRQADKWQDEWPEEEGWWWFFGYSFGRSKLFPEEPELHLVEISRVGSSKPNQKYAFMYITKGHYLEKGEGAVGKWLKANLPKPPKWR